MNRLYTFILLIAFTISMISCEGGLEPPPFEPEPFGAISGTVTYTGEWPPENELRELFFVPMKFTPSAFNEVLSEFLLGNLKSSERLQFYVETDSFFVGELENGAYVYNIIANQFGPNQLNDWRPVGVYDENDGTIFIEGDTVQVAIHVDFNNLPPFPPE